LHGTTSEKSSGYVHPRRAGETAAGSACADARAGQRGTSHASRAAADRGGSYPGWLRTCWF